MNISPFLSVNQSCDEALQWAQARLQRAGLRSAQTFDLRTARVGSRGCPCPNHGSEDCDCQMAVVLVYGEVPAPETLILHGNNEQTWLSIAEAPRQRESLGLRAAILQALDPNIAVSPFQIE